MFFFCDQQLKGTVAPAGYMFYGWKEQKYEKNRWAF